jgi:flavorubredoxin
MRVENLFRKASHNWMVMGRDKGRRVGVVDSNHYMIQHNGRGLLLDPGGVENFSLVAAEFSKHFDLADLETMFVSCQDPDVISSLSLWVQTNPKLSINMSKIWTEYVTHSGINADNIKGINDDGGFITLGGHDLELIPAHYLHSPGNFSLYDPQAKILFSGKIGSAVIPDEYADFYVTEFADYIGYMDGYHRRWMASNSAKSRWVSAIRKRNVDMICPSHGAIFKGEDVERFLNWFDNLDVGNA